MFVNELTPFMRELAHQPIAFLGGFFSGVFSLDLTEDPVKSWLNKQGANPAAGSPMDSNSRPIGNSKGPQSIDID
ncbi:MAG: hypothetical protein HLUCCA11_13240 [Phormidesmis priestleyi Ana]|uniref:Uncharacterized protein n=1 Tax=Phormidesmis priestleyi Ana TaxID=1666911 RepID=A0A0P7YW36_9CYAN|nr:MAG: hypothetical protein HLUCCA11_13240 [Phormidesmis priestleyi Ana]